ncbi:hypothetical protein FSP39_005976 [Pinctada imbricata]|uniref:EF-hand domain-containing protein n=1 Tax=Pinctada imbricata TaxID=66713 RepID=A0AA89BY46_PINIB|nr:hypothetical protein FSP39_005976 [Pinctada imbricata]
MAQYADRLARPSLTPLSLEDMEQLASQKAHELFAVCDKEQKGFITKRDMQRLQAELPLDPDQLEAVFDSLDDDKNGYLTLEEFTGGFGMFLGLNTDIDDIGPGGEESRIDSVYEEAEDTHEEEKMFHNMMESLGANKVFEDDSTLRSLWTKIHRDEPELMANFEDFLYKVTNDIQRSKIDFESLETALKSKTTAHDEEVRKLYEEMEYQIKSEKEKIQTEEQIKERQLREAMEQELKEKDRQLQDLYQKHHEMESRLKDLNMMEAETKQENEKLVKEKETLEDMLMKSEENLEESKAYISQLRNQQKDEKRERARAAIKLTENIALERESLVKQLDLLKDVNKKLRDDQDEAETRRILEAEANAKNTKSRRKELCKQGSILGKYFPSNRGRFESTQESVSEGEDDTDLDDKSKSNNNNVDNLDDLNDEDDDIDDIECDDDFIESDNNAIVISNNNEKNVSVIENGNTTGYRGEDDTDRGHNSNNTGSSKCDDFVTVLDSLTSSEGEINVGSTGTNRQKQYKKQRKKSRMKDESKLINANVQSLQTVEENSLDIVEDYEELSDNIDIQVAPAYEEICDPSCRRNSILMETSFESLNTLEDVHYHNAQGSETQDELKTATSNCDGDRIQYNEGQPKRKVKKLHKQSSTQSSDKKKTMGHKSSAPPAIELKEVSPKHAVVNARYDKVQLLKNNPEREILFSRNQQENFSPSSPRGQPVGAVNEEEEVGEEATVAMRQRIFKVVFIGDSGVGKSSFIHRFCCDHFNPMFSATIGVDFQVKTLVIDSQIIVLQLWDTAGQERFRSITKQYFRKADGVVIMYDVTSETSFKSVRNWMSSVQDGVEDGTAVVIVGNKTDMCEGEDKRAVKSKDGLKLTMEYDGIFYETSAKSGNNIKECMDALARVLKEKEDDELEKSLHLEDPVKKKSCCGR